MEPARRSEYVLLLLVTALACAVIAGCSRQEPNTPERAQNARETLAAITKELHVPSASASGTERLRLQNEAAKRYLELVIHFPEQSNVCAQVLRSAGNIYAAQTNIDAAVKQFSSVGTRYPTERWETLQAWKSAGDLLWESGRKADAKQYYSNIVARFDAPDEPTIIKTVVRGSRAKLGD